MRCPPTHLPSPQDAGGRRAGSAARRAALRQAHSAFGRHWGSRQDAGGSERVRTSLCEPQDAASQTRPLRTPYATDDEALAAFFLLARLEGIIPALESAHAIAEAVKRAPGMPRDGIMIVNLSGRGDKDLDTVMKEAGKQGRREL